MNQDFSVVVGTVHSGWGNTYNEREELASKIKKVGFRVEEIPCLWPRDRYVFVDGKYFTREKAGFCSEGGYFRFGKDFVIVSEMMSDKSRKFGKPREEAEEIHGEEVLERVKEHFPNRRVYLVPFGKTFREFFIHIDLTTFIAPSRNLLVIDRFFYRNNEIDQFGSIAAAENLTLEVFSSYQNESGLLFPLNSLVLPYKENEEIVFSNAGSQSFSDILKKHDLRNVGVNMPLTPFMRGSIHCCTNTKDNTRDINDLIIPEV